MARVNILTALALLGCCCTIAQASPSCLDENGQAVDWFFYYKMPHFEIYFNSDDSGLEYAYVDANNYDSWKLDYQHINATGTSFTNTFNQIDVETFQTTASVFWNDSPLNTTYSDAYAQSKGFFVTDEDAGFYVTHSLPNFPSFNAEGEFEPYLSSEDIWFGNHLLCLSMTSEDIHSLAGNLRINFPRVFGGNLPKSFEEAMPNVKAYLNMEPQGQVYGTVDLQTSAGFKFTNFAHNATMNTYFFEDILAPALDTDIMVESWGRNYMPSFCKPDHKYNSMNILYINFNVEEAFHFMSGRDSSKWQMSADPEKPYICFGDLNRMPDQNMRGGGTTCFYDQPLYDLFRSIAVVWEACEEVDVPYFLH